MASTNTIFSWDLITFKADRANFEVPPAKLTVTGKRILNTDDLLGLGNVTAGSFLTTGDSNGISVENGTILHMHEATGGSPGLISANAQTFLGNKTFNGNVLVPNATTQGVGAHLASIDPNGRIGIGGVTAGSFVTSPNATGMTLDNGNVLHLTEANQTNPGLMSGNAQIFNGNKTFTNNVLIPNTSAPGAGAKIATIESDDGQVGSFTMAIETPAVSIEDGTSSTTVEQILPIPNVSTNNAGISLGGSNTILLTKPGNYISKLQFQMTDVPSNQTYMQVRAFYGPSAGSLVPFDASQAITTPAISGFPTVLNYIFLNTIFPGDPPLYLQFRTIGNTTPTPGTAPSWINGGEIFISAATLF